MFTQKSLVVAKKSPVAKYAAPLAVGAGLLVLAGSASAVGFDISGTTLETDAVGLVGQAVTIALAVGVAIVGLVMGMHILKYLRGAA
jgi:hypothetical protein